MHDWPPSAWVGLSSGGFEIAGNAYARLASDFAGTATLAANVASLQWPMAYPHAWGAIDAVGVWDAETGGTLLVTAPVVPALTVGAYDTPRIAAGGLTITETTVGTPYGMGRYGRGRYATRHILSGDVLLAVTFSRYDPCSSGVWTPAAACSDGTWTATDPCSPGTWGPPPSPLRRAA